MSHITRVDHTSDFENKLNRYTFDIEMCEPRTARYIVGRHFEIMYKAVVFKDGVKFFESQPSKPASDNSGQYNRGMVDANRAILWDLFDIPVPGDDEPYIDPNNTVKASEVVMIWLQGYYGDENDPTFEESDLYYNVTIEIGGKTPKRLFIRGEAFKRLENIVVNAGLHKSRYATAEIRRYSTHEVCYGYEAGDVNVMIGTKAYPINPLEENINV